MKKNILVVDDSALMRRVICDIINKSNEFEAKDTCKDGLEAYDKIKANHYDAVLLDINMPRMNGLELLQKLQKENIRVTVLVVSSLTQNDASISMRALEAGALDVVPKPENIIEAKGRSFRTLLEEKLGDVIRAQAARPGVASKTVQPPLKPAQASLPSQATLLKPASLPASSQSTLLKPALSQSPPLKPVPSQSPSPKPAQPSLPSQTSAVSSPVRKKAFISNSGNKKLVALACSTGGPRALQSVIPYLDKNIDAPVVLVQHMPKGFTKSMAERLDELSKVSVKEAEENDVLRKGVVYVAPGGYHLQIISTPDGNHKVHLSDAPAIGGLKPCANVMYSSLKSSTYDRITCVVLTGMGADGTDGIKDLNTTKSIYVIAQDEPSCVVYGMPKAVAEAGLTDEVVPLTNISKRIINQVGVR